LPGAALLEHRQKVSAHETQKRRPAYPRLLDRRDDAKALMTGRSRKDLLCRSDEHLVAAGDGPLCAASRALKAPEPAAMQGLAAESPFPRCWVSTSLPRFTAGADHAADSLVSVL
jgi:hypothetical protein